MWGRGGGQRRDRLNIACESVHQHYIIPPLDTPLPTLHHTTTGYTSTNTTSYTTGYTSTNTTSYTTGYTSTNPTSYHHWIHLHQHYIIPPLDTPPPTLHHTTTGYTSTNTTSYHHWIHLHQHYIIPPLDTPLPTLHHTTTGYTSTNYILPTHHHLPTHN